MFLTYAMHSHAYEHSTITASTKLVVGERKFECMCLHVEASTPLVSPKPSGLLELILA